MADFATDQDVIDRRGPFADSAEQARAVTRLGDASGLLRLAMPGIDQRIADDAAAAAAGDASKGYLGPAVKALVVEVVRRVLDNPWGAKRLQETIGPKGYSLDLGDGQTGIFFTEDELAPLQPSGVAGVGSAMGSAIVTTRQGWAPRRHCNPWGWPTDDDWYSTSP